MLCLSGDCCLSRGMYKLQTYKKNSVDNAYVAQGRAPGRHSLRQTQLWSQSSVCDVVGASSHAPKLVLSPEPE